MYDPADNDSVITELILAGKAGNSKALTSLIELYSPSIHRVVYSIVRDENIVEDLAQETFLKMLAALKHYEFRAPFRSWLLRIAVNLCRDHLRKKKVRKIMTLFQVNEDSGEEQSFSGSEPDPATLFERVERKMLLEKALERLPQNSRVVLIMRELEELSYEEIAEILHWKMGTVKSRLFRARQELAKELSPHREEIK
ncbi:MAG: RNA polymerase sigma factor [Calditrichaeota bacterium]|nr:MAG: RNA polymerase sigma factor [Calditrichota bacterium]